MINTDPDADGETILVFLGVTSSYRTLALNLVGSFTYTPVADFYGIDTFNYLVFEGMVASNVARVTTMVVNVPETYFLLVILK